MTQSDLYNSLISIKIDTLDCYSIYFNKRKIGDRRSFVTMKEQLIALDIYIQILDWYYLSWVDKDNLEVTEEDITNVIETAIGILRTFNVNRYGA